MSTSPSDRVKIHDYPIAFPSKCVVCGAAPNDGDPRKWVDIGAELEEYGSIYFCTFCIAEVAGAINYVGPGVHMNTVQELIKSENENTTLRAENEEFRRVYSTLHGLGALGDSDNVNVPRSHVSVEDDAPESRESHHKSESRDKESDKLGSVKRSRNVPKPRSDSDNGDSSDGLSF